MDYENKPKAVIIKTFTFGSIELRLTEKGAVTVYRNTDRGVQFVQALRPSDVQLHASLNSPCFQEILASPEWANIQETKEQAKVQRYVESKSQKEAYRATQQIQAAFDKLKALGMDPSQVLKQA